MIGPSPRQADLLDAVMALTSFHRLPPTFREVGALLGIGSSNCVHQQVAALRRKGYLVTPEHKAARSLVLSDLGLRWFCETHPPVAIGPLS